MLSSALGRSGSIKGEPRLKYLEWYWLNKEIKFYASFWQFISDHHVLWNDLIQISYVVRVIRVAQWKSHQVCHSKKYIEIV